ncbi:hypothetical protein K7395_02435 [Streptomyces filamentosus]|uniref:DUF2795 domain-containing protein n=2 Tax=Streptomyces filamentosus TaxID=67294 RepID=A0ABY4UNA6_STRFL|nr:MULTISPECIES: hypothetical protein [Streptomyces]EFE79069.1 predicted protein [Streptomyces filamentosus NRRL 15998]ESU50744.1 hypothetical protein P376_1278 [Streptomyces sp. HCCB10043]EWS95925.1 hypothetical protein SSIG_06698 [Streptomyces filamentosus NRRL 11379]MYR82903.1 hypothetical protein [Streptomyces sp. SID5466]USC45664.1 hypothetical protein K7395_02435 [Streptomyces filamentosus]
MPDEVTRTEIADHLAALFANGALTKHDLLIGAATARAEVREVLRQLPDRSYTELRQIWEDLPRLPVGP